MDAPRPHFPRKNLNNRISTKDFLTRVLDAGNIASFTKEFIMKETISFISACVRFFDVLPGQSKIQFGQEIKKLTPADREEMKPELSVLPLPKGKR